MPLFGGKKKQSFVPIPNILGSDDAERYIGQMINLQVIPIGTKDPARFDMLLEQTMQLYYEEIVSVAVKKRLGDKQGKELIHMSIKGINTDVDIEALHKFLVKNIRDPGGLFGEAMENAVHRMLVFQGKRPA